MNVTGWRLTGALAALLVLLSAAVLAVQGIGEEGVRGWIRATARSSALLFLPVFAARPLHQLARSDTSAWLLRQRRYLGVSVAVSHALHLAAIVWFAVGWTEAYRAEVAPTTVWLGGVTFALLFAMAATSSDAAVRTLGARRWRALHRTGLWALWFVFAATFGGAAAATGSPIHGGLLLALLAVLALRILAYARVRRRVATA